MFKQLVNSVVLGVFLFCSIGLSAKNSDKPVVVAKLNVEQQLSISAHSVGDGKFIQQVSAKDNALKSQKEIPMPLIPGLGVMVFGLMYFVLRSSRQRVK